MERAFMRIYYFFFYFLLGHALFIFSSETEIVIQNIDCLCLDTDELIPVSENNPIFQSIKKNCLSVSDFFDATKRQCANTKIDNKSE